jgi:mitofusin
MRSGREALEESLESVEEAGAGDASSRTKLVLNDNLERVGQGKLGVEKSLAPMPSYPSLLRIFDYARDVRRALLASLDAAVILVEDEARRIKAHMRVGLVGKQVKCLIGSLHGI